MAAGQEDSQKADNSAGVRKRTMAGAAVLLVLLLAACLYFVHGRSGSQPPAMDAPVMGVLDLQQAAKAHPDYDKLAMLRQ